MERLRPQHMERSRQSRRFCIIRFRISGALQWSAPAAAHRH
jgi:hypothetical protein